MKTNNEVCNSCYDSNNQSCIENLDDCSEESVEQCRELLYRKAKIDLTKKSLANLRQEVQLDIMAEFINESLIPRKVNFGKAFFIAKDIKRMNEAMIVAENVRPKEPVKNG